MSELDVVDLLLRYGYILYVPLIFIEGNVVAISSGILAALGYFNIFILWILFIVADFLSDLVILTIGKKGEDFVNSRGMVKRIIKKINEKKSSAVSLSTIVNKYFEAILVFGKLLPIPQLPTVTLLVSGYSNIPFKRFLKVFLFIEPIKAIIYIMIGYYIGTGITDWRYFISTEGVSIAMMIVMTLVALYVTYRYFFKRNKLDFLVD